MPLLPVRSFAEVEQIFAEAAALPNEGERINHLCTYYLTLDEFPFPDDPFSEGYRRRALELWTRLCGRPEYRPVEHEVSGYATGVDVRCPPPYNVGSGELLGDLLICWGFLMKALDLKPGQSILEYGPGSGQILVNFARMGVRAAGIDIDGPQVAVIEQQGRLLGGLDLRAKVGQFGDPFEPGERFDAVLFFEAFHHSLDHIALVDRLHDLVADDGRLVVASEPILTTTNPFRPVVPFPWGPRLDLLSLRATRTFGWMELGFQEEYFYRLLLRGGWLPRKHLCPLTDRGTLYTARKNTGRVSAGELELGEDEAATWHSPEGENRWTCGRGEMTLDSRPRWTSVSVVVSNYNPKPVGVELACGPGRVAVTLAPGETAEVAVPLSAGTRRLVVESPTFVPKDVGMNDDTRTLGVFVGRITYS